MPIYPVGRSGGGVAGAQSGETGQIQWGTWVGQMTAVQAVCLGYPPHFQFPHNFPQVKRFAWVIVGFLGTIFCNMKVLQVINTSVDLCGG